MMARRPENASASRAALERGRLPTNLRLLLILEAVAGAGRPLTVAEINAEIGLPKPTIHRLCARLVEEGFLRFLPDGRRLRPGRRLRLLASGVLFASASHIARHQILVDLARHYGETVNFVVPEADGMRYVDRVETDWPFRVQLPIGTHVPFHCTASGKTYLASLPAPVRRRLVAALRLDPLTERTITDPEALLAELARVAEQGFAIDNEEFVTGMVAIAAPVRDPAGRFIAAVAYHGPTLRLSIERMIADRGALLAAADRLARAVTEDEGGDGAG